MVKNFIAEAIKIPKSFQKGENIFRKTQKNLTFVRFYAILEMKGTWFMPKSDVKFYRDGEDVPVLDWLRSLQRRDRKAHTKCVEKIFLLREFGSDLRRPVADYLDDGIYELRISHQRVNYRILYAFVGPNIALLTNGLVKEKRIPPAEIALAQRRKRVYESNPETHYFDYEWDDES